MLLPIFGGWSTEPTVKAFIYLHFSTSLVKGESLGLGLVPEDC